MKQYFGKDGLTSTSANHIANIAKEMYEGLESNLEAIRLYSRDYTLAVNGQTYTVETESTKDDLQSLSSSLKEIASLKGLIAWLREAIKEKDELSSEEGISKWIDEQIKADKIKLIEPLSDAAEDFDAILALEPADRQGRFYALQAKCATLGKFIHPDGDFAKARKEFYEKKRNPTTICGSGQDAEVNSFRSSFTSEEIDNEFFALQREYRKAQAEFNSMKSELEAKLADSKKAIIDYRREMIFGNALTKKNARLERKKELRALKIVIPSSLMDIYQKVSEVANAK